MTDVAATILALVVMFVGLPVLVLRLMDRRRNVRRQRGGSSLASDVARKAHERRLLQPDWSCVERYLGRPAPQALRDLFADRALVTRCDLNYTDAQVISTFEPLEEQTIAELSKSLGFAAVPIATTGFGDTVYLRAGAGEVDAVYVTYHDGGETEVFAESVAQMLSALRQANAPG
jgi:hypothetical protein